MHSVYNEQLESEYISKLDSIEKEIGLFREKSNSIVSWDKTAGIVLDFILIVKDFNQNVNDNMIYSKPFLFKTQKTKKKKITLKSK